MRRRGRHLGERDREEGGGREAVISSLDNRGYTEMQLDNEA